MAADNEFTVPEAARRFLEGRGYVLDGTMAAHIARWREWYTRASGAQSGEVHDFYNVPYTTVANGSSQKRHRRRLSLNPAKRACQEWASLVLNEDTAVSVEQPGANAWLQRWLDANDFWPTGQQMVEAAYATGTGAWALWADVREDVAASLKLRSYDARMVIPLSWDSEGVTECAFCQRVHVGGSPMTQLTLHRMGDAGSYVIECALFDKEGKAADPEEHGFLAEWDTGCPTPTFGIVRPGISNTVADASPYGQSVFHDATGGAIQALDMAFDALFQEVKLTEAMVFLDDQLIDVRSQDGRLIPVAAGDDGDRKFRKLAGQAGSELYEVYSPEIRTGPLRDALDVALAEFGEQCGFGQDYFTLDDHGGLKTATEVASDNSTLMRNIRKHENALRRAICQVARALLTVARVRGLDAGIEEDFGEVSVTFDDSIITDTKAEKTMMLSEVAAGVLPRWKYLEKFYGMDEETARAMADEAVGLPAAPEDPEE